MKMSYVSEERLRALTPLQKWELVCGSIKDDGASAEVALLLGTRPTIAKERALAAAQLYRDGRVRYIVPSGGVKWNCGGELLSEAHFMARILEEEGVPKDAIILENEATTTKENMIYGTLQINRKTKFNEKTIIIVTSLNHMQRSLALAKTFLPRMAEISGYPSYPAEDKEEWLKSQENRKSLDSALRLTKGLVDRGIIEDFEIGLD